MTEFSDILSSFREGNVFLHGPGGTGKSYTIAKIMKLFIQKGEKVSCTASTGIASVNLNTDDFKATTLHKWTGLQLCQKPIDECVDIIMKKFPLKRMWQTTRYLIIDEISMISGLFFEKLNSIAKIVRGNDRPFGGIHVLVSGDFLQLPPVEGGWIFLTEAWKEMNFKIFSFTTPQRYPDVKWFEMLARCREGKLNHSDLLALDERVKAYKKYLSGFSIPQLSKEEILSYRNSSSLGIEVSCSICLSSSISDSETESRSDSVTRSDSGVYAKTGCGCFNAKSSFMHSACLLGWLSTCSGESRKKCPMCKTFFSGEFCDALISQSDASDLKVKPTILFSTRAEVEELNSYESELLSSSSFTINALDTYYDIKSNVIRYEKQPVFNDAIPEKITLKIGAQVMLKWNIETDAGLANGTRGVIVDCKKINSSGSGLGDQDSASGPENYMIKVKWYNGLTTIVEQQTWSIEDDYCKRSRTQIPLVLAWALTIHKSQGCTLDYVICDLGSSVFAPGQAYVALSRVKTLEGLLISQIDYSCLFKQDKSALDFVKNNSS